MQSIYIFTVGKDTSQYFVRPSELVRPPLRASVDFTVREISGKIAQVAFNFSFRGQNLPMVDEAAFESPGALPIPATGMKRVYFDAESREVRYNAFLEPAHFLRLIGASNQVLTVTARGSKTTFQATPLFRERMRRARDQFANAIPAP